MSDYRITYGIDGVAKSHVYSGESEADAIEQHENIMEYYEFDHDVEFVGIVELDEGWRGHE